MYCVLLLAIVALPLPRLHAEGAPFELPRQYTAEIESQVGGMATPMKLYVDGQKSRMELTTQGMQTAVISRVDRKVVYNLMPLQKKYMEMPMSEEQARQADPTAIGANAQWEKLGTETINGQSCNKYKVTATSPTDPAAKTVSLFDFNASTNDPVRVTVDAEGQQIVVDFKSFKRGAPDASLFEVPKGYEKFGMPALPAGITIPGQ